MLDASTSHVLGIERCKVIYQCSQEIHWEEKPLVLNKNYSHIRAFIYICVLTFNFVNKIISNINQL